MIKDRDIAEKVSQALREAYRELDESIWLVQAGCSEAEANIYRHLVGNILGRIVFDVMEPLYKEQPQLKPPAWDD